MAERWSSRLGFILAAIGAAVGLGNIWRFSAVVGQNGGGAYLIPYFLAAFLFGVPMMVLEMSVGRRYRADVVTAFRSVRRRFEVVGWLITGSVLLILSYYLVITGWVLAFLGFSLTGADTSFAAYTSTYWPLLTFAVSGLLAASIVSLGVKDGIERLSSLLVPLIFLILIGLAGYAATLPGFSAGFDFFLTPDFSVLSDPFLWSAAFGQIFFSLSVGQGIMLTYGAYLDESTRIPRSALLITVADLSVAVLAGLVIFPVVFTFGLEPTLGTELAFVTLPRAFAELPFGHLLAVAFFALLFVAAITSAVSMLEVGVASVTRSTRLNRRPATLAATGFVLLAGVPSALSYSAADVTALGVRFLDLMDETVGSLALPISALLIAVVFTWLQDPETLRNELDHPVLVLLTKYVVPPVLLIVTAAKLLAGRDFPAWRFAPRMDAFIGTPAQLLVTLAVLALLLLGGRYMKRYRPIRRMRRRTGK